MNYVCRYLFLRDKVGREFRQINPSQTLMNLQYRSSLCLQHTTKKSRFTVWIADDGEW